MLLWLGACQPFPSTNQKALESNKLESLKGGLLTTQYPTIEALKSVVEIKYYNNQTTSWATPQVRLSHTQGDQKVMSILKSGVNETDIKRAIKGNLDDRIYITTHAPDLIRNRKDLQRVFVLARRMPRVFGVNDYAFYYLAQQTMNNINDEDKAHMPPESLSEKGYLNTFNHITAQAFITTIFSEWLADFIADAHELSRVPELVTGHFSEEQLVDRDNGAVDNYVDMINNEWGQELGKLLKAKYKIDRNTMWTPELLSDYMNDIQRFYTRTFQIGFKPFTPSDEIIINFAKKINRTMSKNIPNIKAYT